MLRDSQTEAENASADVRFGSALCVGYIYALLVLDMPAEVHSLWVLHKSDFFENIFNKFLDNSKLM